jgi:hypothetical protein
VKQKKKKKDKLGTAVGSDLQKKLYKNEMTS